MPIYEYECNKCGETFEIMQAISAKPLKTCVGDECKGKVRRLVSASGFILKGDGWYATDYPSDSRKKGWEEERKAANSKEPAPAAPAGKGSEAPQPKAEKPKPEPARAKSSSKNPYTSGKKDKKAQAS